MCLTETVCTVGSLSGATLVIPPHISPQAAPKPPRPVALFPPHTSSSKARALQVRSASWFPVLFCRFAVGYF